MKQKDKQEWEVFFEDIMRIHPAPTIVMIRINDKSEISLIAAATTQQALATTLKQANPIYPGYIG